MDIQYFHLFPLKRFSILLFCNLVNLWGCLQLAWICMKIIFFIPFGMYGISYYFLLNLDYKKPTTFNYKLSQRKKISYLHNYFSTFIGYLVYYMSWLLWSPLRKLPQLFPTIPDNVWGKKCCDYCHCSYKWE